MRALCKFRTIAGVECLVNLNLKWELCREREKKKKIVIVIILFSCFRKRFRNIRIKEWDRRKGQSFLLKKGIRDKILAMVYKYYIWPDLYKPFCSPVMEQHVEVKVSTANWLIWVIWRLHIMQLVFLHTSASYHVSVNALRWVQKTRQKQTWQCALAKEQRGTIR